MHGLLVGNQPLSNGQEIQGRWMGGEMYLQFYTVVIEDVRPVD